MNVTFGSGGDVVDVMSAGLVPSLNSSVLGSYTSTVLGLSVVYLDNVLISPPLFTQWMGNGKNLLASACICVEC